MGLSANCIRVSISVVLRYSCWYDVWVCIMDTGQRGVGTLMRRRHCFLLESNGVCPTYGGALQKMIRWITSVCPCLLYCLCWLLPWFLVLEVLEHVGVSLLTKLCHVAGRGHRKGSIVITRRNCGCRGAGGHNVSTVCKCFFHPMGLKFFCCFS